MNSHKHPFEGQGWYLVKGLGHFGNTADDFTGPFGTNQEAVDKLEVYGDSEGWEILYVAADGFAYVDEPDEA